MIRHGKWWLDPQNVLQEEFLHPREHEKLIFTDLRLRRSLRSRIYRGSLVSSRKVSTHQPVRNEGSFSGPTILQKDLSKQSSPHCHRQHLSGGIHQQTGWHSISRTLCPDVENPNMVQSEQCDTQSTTHPGITQCNSVWSFQEEPDPINRMVPFSTNLQTN